MTHAPLTAIKLLREQVKETIPQTGATAFLRANLLLLLNNRIGGETVTGELLGLISSLRYELRDPQGKVVEKYQGLIEQILDQFIELANTDPYRIF